MHGMRAGRSELGALVQQAALHLHARPHTRPPWPAPACSGPYGLQPKGAATFNFTALDSAGQAAQGVPGYECWLEATAGGGGAAAYTRCTSPAAVPADLADGQYRFHARVAGTSGAAGTEAVAPFGIDSVAPTVEFQGARVGAWGLPPVLCMGPALHVQTVAARCAWRLCRAAPLARPSCAPAARPAHPARLPALCAAESPEGVHNHNTSVLQFTANEEGSAFFCG